MDFSKDSINGHKAYLKSHIVYCTLVFWHSHWTRKKLEHPLVRCPVRELPVLVESGVGVLYDASPAVASNKAQSLWRNLAVLHVEQLQLAAVCCQSFESSACYALAGSEAHPPQALAVHGQLLQPTVWHERALTHIQRLELGAASGQVAQAVVCKSLAAPRIQVTQSRAVASHVAHAHVGDAGAVGHAQVAQAALEACDFAQTEIPHQAAVAETKLSYRGAVESEVAQRFVCQSGAAA